MKKSIIGMLCGALAVAMAVPAFATHELGGILRTQFVREYANPNAKDGATKTFVAQRLRAKWTNTINDYVTVIWYGEVDTQWGGNAGDVPGDNGGGRLGADGINVETKNVYAIVKLPGTMDVTVMSGIMGWNDQISSVFFHQDAATLTAIGKFDMITAQLIYSKWAEGEADVADDTDTYGVRASLKASDMISVGAEVYYTHDQTAQEMADIYTMDINAMVKLSDMIGLHGFFAYQTGKLNDGSTVNTETDLQAMVGNLGADFNFDAFNAALNVIYYGKDDDAQDDMTFKGGAGALEFYKLNSPLMLADIYKTSGFQDRIALKSAAYAGYGLLGIVANAGANFDPFFVKGTVGYYMALDEQINDSGVDTVAGKNLGTEIALMVGTKVADAVKVSVLGSYVVLGDFFDGTAANNEDPDDLYSARIIMDIPF